MALVAYDYDSTSENEEENSPSSSSVIIPNKQSNFNVNGEVHKFTVNSDKKDFLDNNISIEQSVSTETSTSSLFSDLPVTKIVTEVVEDQIEDFIPKPPSIPVKKEKQKVKISIPSLLEFQDIDDDGPKLKKKKPLSGSGLISLLPPVKGAVKSNTTFVPNVISNKNKQAPITSKPNSLVPNIVRKNVDINKGVILKKSKEKIKIVLSDAESDDDLDIPETYDDEMWEKVCGRTKPKPIVYEIKELPPTTINIAPEPEKPYEGLDNKAFKELVGKSKRPLGNIKLIDINEEEILADKDLWMSKSLTDPDMAPKTVIDDPVDPTRRRKHHITYLAQQAKANEQDLKNQWAANKNNKFASRAKYGF